VDTVVVRHQEGFEWLHNYALIHSEVCELFEPWEKWEWCSSCWTGHS